MLPFSFVWTAASAVGKIPPSLFEFNGKPEVNKTNIKKNAKISSFKKHHNYVTRIFFNIGSGTFTK